MFIFTVETVICAILIAVFILLKAYWSIKGWWVYKDCQHEKFHETSACDAICSNCKKNLGFIGAWRDRQ